MDHITNDIKMDYYHFIIIIYYITYIAHLICIFRSMSVCVCVCASFDRI